MLDCRCFVNGGSFFIACFFSLFLGNIDIEKNKNKKEVKRAGLMYERNLF